MVHSWYSMSPCTSKCLFVTTIASLATATLLVPLTVTTLTLCLLPLPHGQYRSLSQHSRSICCHYHTVSTAHCHNTHALSAATVTLSVPLTVTTLTLSAATVTLSVPLTVTTLTLRLLPHDTPHTHTLQLTPPQYAATTNRSTNTLTRLTTADIGQLWGDFHLCVQ